MNKTKLPSSISTSVVIDGSGSGGTTSLMIGISWASSNINGDTSLVRAKNKNNNNY